MKFHRLALIVLAILCASCARSQDSSQEEVFRPTRLDDIMDYRVGVQTGSAQDMNLSKAYPDVDFIRLNTPAELIAATQNGNIDYFYIDTIVAVGADLEAMGIEAFFSEKGDGYKVASAFRKEDTELCNALNAYILRSKANGKLDYLTKKWYRHDVSDAVMPEAKYYPDGKTLHVGTSNFFPFFFIKDGEWAGFEMEMMQEFADSLGMNLEVMNCDLAGLIPALVTGKIDVITSFLFITEERSKQVLFSEPYTNCRSSCFGKDPEAVSGEGAFGDTAGGGSAGGQEKGFWETTKDRFRDNVLVENRWKLILSGLWETILISLFSIIFGTIVGGVVCRVMLSRNSLVKGCGRVYCKAITGIPILVFLMLLFYVVFSSSGVSARWVSIIAFSLYFGATTSEIFLTGFKSVDKGQTEAGLALGFSPLATRIHFILPQAVHKIAALYRGEVSSLIKNTSVVGYIAVQDLTKVSDIIRSRTFDAFFPLIIISVLYFLLAWLMGKFLDKILDIK